MFLQISIEVVMSQFCYKKNDKKTIFSFFFCLCFLSKFLFVLCKTFFLIILNHVRKLFVIPKENWRDIVKIKILEGKLNIVFPN